MYYLIQSNQGNHTGLNRKWTLLQRSESLETLTDKLKSIIYNSSDNHSIDEQGNVTDENGNLRYEHGSTGAEYDLFYYYIFSEEEAERFQYDTGHYSGVYDLIENSEGTKSFLSETAERAQEAITARKEFKEAQNEWMQARRRSEEAEAEYRRIVVNLRAMKEAEANAELLKNNKEHELAKAQIKYWEAVEKERAEREATKREAIREEETT